MQQIASIRSIGAKPRPVAGGCRILIGFTAALALVTLGIVDAAGADERGQPHSKPEAQAQEDAKARGAGQEAVGKRLEAAGRRIKAAVANGEMTEDEAWAEWYAARDEIMTAAVESGEISKGEAADFGREIHKGELGERLKAAGGRLKAAVASGEMTEDKAWAEWQATQKELIEAAVEAGEISEKDAADFGYDVHKSELDKRLEAAGERIKAAAARGEMTEDEAWAEWYATKKELIEAAIQSGEISSQDATDLRREIHRAELSERLGAAGGRIRAAVASGDMTEDEGWAEWDASKEALLVEAVDSGEVSKEDAAEFRREIEKAEVGQKLKAAVAKGEMTEAEAWAAWAEYNQKASGTAPSEDAEEEISAREQATAANANGQLEIDQLAEALELDDTQQAQVQAFTEQNRQRDEARGQKLRSLRSALREARESGDEVRLADLESQIGEVLTGRAAADVVFYDMVNGILEEDQKARFAELRANVEAERELDDLPADLRTTIRAAIKVRLDKQQRTSLKKIRDDARKRLKEARKEDRLKRSRERAAEKALTAKVRAEILKMLDADQKTRYQEALRKLIRARGDRSLVRQRGDSTQGGRRLSKPD